LAVNLIAGCIAVSSYYKKERGCLKRASFFLIVRPHLNPLQRRGLQKGLLKTLSFREGRVRHIAN